MTTRLILCLALTASLIFASCKTTTEQSNVPLVSIAQVASTSGSQQASYPGRIEARNATDLSFLVMGTIEKVFVKEGDYVRKGQEIARLDTRDYQTQLDATLAQYNQIKAECERVIAMHEEHAVSDNDYDKARAGLEQITAKLNHSRAQLNDCVIRAPYNGHIQSVSRHANEVAAPGIPVATIFAEGGLDVVIFIPETEYSRRSIVASYTATFSSLPDQKISLSLSSMASSANANQLYEAHLAVPTNITGLTPGMTAMVEVTYNTPNNDKETAPLTVPLGAIFNDGAHSYVFTLDTNNSSVAQTPINVVKMLNNGTAIVSGQLTIGQPIVASGVRYLSDGQQVRLAPQASDLNVGNVL